MSVSEEKHDGLERFRGGDPELPAVRNTHSLAPDCSESRGSCLCKPDFCNRLCFGAVCRQRAWCLLSFWNQVRHMLVVF